MALATARKSAFMPSAVSTIEGYKHAQVYCHYHHQHTRTEISNEFHPKLNCVVMILTGLSRWFSTAWRLSNLYLNFFMWHVWTVRMTLLPSSLHAAFSTPSILSRWLKMLGSLLLKLLHQCVFPKMTPVQSIGAKRPADIVYTSTQPDE